MRRRMRTAGIAVVLMLLVAACTRGGRVSSEAETSTTSSSVTEQSEGSESTPDGPAQYLQPELPVDARVEDLLARMTLAEKIGQMTLVQKNSIATVDLAGMGIGALLSGGGGAPIENTPEAWAEMVNGFQREALQSRLAIPLLYGVDAVHGHNNVKGAVIFPHNIGLGAADDPVLMERIGRITALEVAATGIQWNYAPAVSVPQDIRWGRTYEGYSENTERVARLAPPYIAGLHGGDLTGLSAVLATPKHYVGDGGTVWGTSETADYWIDQGVTEADEAVLRAIHLPPYVAAIEAGALSIMASYSSWGGEKMHAHEYLLTDVLKGELGFEGFVVSDWAAIDQIADDYYEAVVRAINAGIDMNMVPGDYRRFVSDLTAAVEAGDVSQERIDDAVRRILTAKFSLGLFENPFGDESLLPLVGSEEHRNVAREAVAKSQVLLVNEGGLLPLDADLPTLYVGGQAADDIGIQSGGWTVKWQGGVGEITDGTTLLQAIRSSVDGETNVIYDRRGRFEIDEAVSPVVCVGVAGELPYAEGVGDDGTPELLPSDVEMLEAMRDQCDQLAVVIFSGRPLIITDLVVNWDALVAGWLPGSEGQGVADVLFGVEPFSGTLPYTWPRNMEQVPIDQTDDTDDPLFPYGFGLEGG